MAVVSLMTKLRDLVETFTFLKYKLKKTLLSVEIGECSICDYVGDNVEC